jgi:hypothetical protein
MDLWFEFIDFGGFGGHKSWTYICVRGPSQVERWGVLACDEGCKLGEHDVTIPHHDNHTETWQQVSY